MLGRKWRESFNFDWDLTNLVFGVIIVITIGLFLIPLIAIGCF